MTRLDKYRIKQRKIQTEKGLNFSFNVVNLIFKILFIIGFIYVYARFIATSSLSIKEYQLTSVKIPTSFDGFKIVQISDINYGNSIKIAQLNKDITRINKIKPDLILFTGNLVANNYKLTTKDVKDITNSLTKLKATAGKYSVKGNYDYDNKSDIILKNSQFNILNNTSDYIYYKGYTPILINGINSMLKNDSNIDESFSKVNKDLFLITMFHESDLVSEVIKNHSPDVILAGNTLGGQIRIPLVKGLILSQGSLKYTKDYYNINNIKFYISSGIGSSNYNVRLFNRPSINLFRLKSKNN